MLDIIFWITFTLFGLFNVICSYPKLKVENKVEDGKIIESHSAPINIETGEVLYKGKLLEGQIPQESLIINAPDFKAFKEPNEKLNVTGSLKLDHSKSKIEVMTSDQYAIQTGNISIGTVAYTPSSDIVFYNEDMSKGGRLYVEDGKIYFEGNADDSAKVFFNSVIKEYSNWCKDKDK